MNTAFRISLLAFCLLLVMAASPAAPGAGQPAPDFTLKDSSGKTVKLADYRGKVLLLDFWATWCTGCKEEIPWFIEFQQTYGAKGLATVGVSMDDGWDVVKSFLASHKIPYTIVLGDEAIAKSYGSNDGLPDTFVIDKQGRIAAAYVAKKVNKDAVEAKIKALLAER
jgi:cytochrome c biogenesis protein CcmG/thiol:disulfide interchange protein DsbE